VAGEVVGYLVDCPNDNTIIYNDKYLISITIFFYIAIYNGNRGVVHNTMATPDRQPQGQ
jgi:hypothetical protein